MQIWCEKKQVKHINFSPHYIGSNGHFRPFYEHQDSQKTNHPVQQKSEPKRASRFDEWVI